MLAAELPRWRDSERCGSADQANELCHAAMASLFNGLMLKLEGQFPIGAEPDQLLTALSPHRGGTGSRSGDLAGMGNQGRQGPRRRRARIGGADIVLPVERGGRCQGQRCPGRGGSPAWRVVGALG